MNTGFCVWGSVPVFNNCFFHSIPHGYLSPELLSVLAMDLYFVYIVVSARCAVLLKCFKHFSPGFCGVTFLSRMIGFRGVTFLSCMIGFYGVTFLSRMIGFCGVTFLSRNHTCICTCICMMYTCTCVHMYRCSLHVMYVYMRKNTGQMI